MAIDWKKILSGGGGARNDPYLNERSMFAAKPQPPRKYFSDGSMPKKKAPVPIARPTDPTTAALAAKAYGLLDPANDRVNNATSPSSLMGSTAPPNVANATSPSSLMVSPAAARGGPGGGTATGQAPPYPTISSDTTGFQSPPVDNTPTASIPPTRYPTVAQDQNDVYLNPWRPPTHYPTIASDATGVYRAPTVAQDQTAVPEQNWPSVDQLPPAQDPGVNPFNAGFWWQPKRPGSTPRPDMVGNAPLGAVQRGASLAAPYPNADVQKGARPTAADAWAGWETDPATGMRRKIRNAAGGTGFDSGRFGSGGGGPAPTIFDLLRGGR